MEIFRQSETESLPFVQLPVVVMADRKLSNTDKIVYLAILRFAFQKSVCYPSIARIAEMAGSSESTVRRSIKNIEERGLIAIESRSDMGTTNVYNFSGGVDNAYADDSGFLTDDTIAMLAEAGEVKLVKRLQKERQSLTGVLKTDPPPIIIEEDLVSKKTKRQVTLTRSYEEIRAKQEDAEKTARDLSEKRKKHRQSKSDASISKKNARRQNSRSLEVEWHDAMVGSFPGHSGICAPWSIKQKSMAKMLITNYGYNDTLNALLTIIEKWNTYVDRYGVRGYPSIDLISAYHRTWIPEALNGAIDPRTKREKAMCEGEYTGDGSEIRYFDGTEERILRTV